MGEGMGSQTDTGKAAKWTAACEQTHQGAIRETDCFGAAETGHPLHDHYEGWDNSSFPLILYHSLGVPAISCYGKKRYVSSKIVDNYACAQLERDYDWSGKIAHFLFWKENINWKVRDYRFFLVH